MPILYKNSEGFKIHRRKGDVEYFADTLKTVVMKYGLSEFTDYEELFKIVEIVDKYICVNF